MENMTLYEKVRSVPESAQKSFNNGRFKGTDINPMWRIKKLTEMFGPCGVGWYIEPMARWYEDAGDERCVFVEIYLYVKQVDGWSRPIYGIGGSKLIQTEKKGRYINDEAYKMATTDAISVACKHLGMGADVYWQNDNTKYNDMKKPAANDIDQQVNKAEATRITPIHVDTLQDMILDTDTSAVEFMKYYGVEHIEDMTEAQYGNAMNMLVRKKNRKEERVIGAE